MALVCGCMKWTVGENCLKIASDFLRTIKLALLLPQHQVGRHQPIDCGRSGPVRCPQAVGTHGRFAELRALCPGGRNVHAQCGGEPGPVTDVVSSFPPHLGKPHYQVWLPSALRQASAGFPRS